MATLVILGVGLSSVVLGTESASAARASTSAGAAAIGSASYAAPSNAIYVSPSGSDSSSGSVSAPLRTVGRALGVVPSGGTIVLRGGNYNEYVIVTKSVTIQNYPGEAAWFDGSTTVGGWVADGNRWRKDGWTTRFDHSPTYTKGAADSTVPYWQFVNPSTAPMAAHPDAVWIGGKQQKQVQYLSQLTAGTFYLDESSSKLYLGSNPNGAEVRASNVAQAMSVRAPNVTIRGIGVRRYATSVWMLGSVVLEQPNALLENVRVSESATTGISVLGSGTTLRQVTVDTSGMLGVHGRYADNITFDRVLSQYNNSEGFNLAPVSGGVKLGQTRGVTVRDSSFSNNYGHGFWEDMSVYNSVFRGTDFNDNSGDGLFLEISAKAVVGDNRFIGNDLDGIKVNNTSNVQIWNNTFVGNGRPLELVQDSRRNNNRSDAAVDPRVSWPDPEMPWQLDSVTVSNNIVALSTSVANCLVCVEDYSQQESAEQMKVSWNGNVFNRASSSAPTWLAVWSRGAGNPGVYTTLAAFKSATGQESRGREYTGAAVVSGSGVPNQTVLDAASSVAVALPSGIASTIGWSAGTTKLGASTDSSTSVPTTPTEPTDPTPTTPPPTTSGTVAKDDFSRTVNGGWGTADTGGAWTIPAGSSKFSVGSGVGRMLLNRGDGFRANLASASSTSVDVRLAMAADQRSGSDGHWLDVIGRSVSGQGDYGTKLKLASDGTVSVWLYRTSGGTLTSLAEGRVGGLTYNGGDTVQIRLQVVGTGTTQLRVKVWKGGTTEPSNWTYTASDSTAGLQKAGSLALSSYTGGSPSGGPITMAFDAFSATTV